MLLCPTPAKVFPAGQPLNPLPNQCLFPCTRPIGDGEYHQRDMLGLVPCERRGAGGPIEWHYQRVQRTPTAPLTRNVGDVR